MRSGRGGTARTRLVAGVLRRDDRILLCHRRPSRDHYPDVWDLPGGHVDPYETLPEALVRELGEELGIRLPPPSEPPWAVLHTDDLELNVFLVDGWEGEPANLATDEHDAIRWVASGELDRLPLADPSYSRLLRSTFQ